MGILLIIAAIVGYFYFTNSQEPKQLIGDETLNIKVTMDNGTPLSKLEVDLWRTGSNGPPDAGISYTDEQGIVTFKIPEGSYDIGFNMDNFPGNLNYPEKAKVIVDKGIPSSKTILITAKQGE
ncbi:MAG: DUF4198 domain-containing protein [Actinobacteria bacterium]|nr:DUF4198 domain-containing protein [Actinomycetota bacterium]